MNRVPLWGLRVFTAPLPVLAVAGVATVVLVGCVVYALHDER